MLSVVLRDNLTFTLETAFVTHNLCYSLVVSSNAMICSAVSISGMKWSGNGARHSAQFGVGIKN
jgi:hypothetical protein